MPVVTNFIDDAGTVDLGTKYVTKEYMLQFYPDLIPAQLTPLLYTWGRNSVGQLGDGTTSSRSSPVNTSGAGTNWARISICGESGGTLNSAAAGVKTDGTLWTWGWNNFGQLGDNTTSNRSSPVTITGAGTNWRQVACGANHMGAIKTDGTLWTWGLNNRGQLGTGNTTNRSSPVTTSGGGTNWKQISCGYRHTAAIKTDGTLWTWGSNDVGMLGDNTTSSRSSPVTTTGGGTNWIQVSCGYRYTCGIKTDGTLWTFGSNLTGQLGDNTTSNRSSPVTTTGGGTNWDKVFAGSSHVAATKTNGALWIWGSNQTGQLGDNTTSNRSSPVTTTGGGTNWISAACGYRHTLAIKTDGTLWVWGQNNNGQLATNNTSNFSSPVTTILGGTSWKQIAAYTQTSLATTETGGW